MCLCLFDVLLFLMSIYLCVISTLDHLPIGPYLRLDFETYFSDLFGYNAVHWTHPSALFFVTYTMQYISENQLILHLPFKQLQKLPRRLAVCILRNSLTG